jgi:hypothetical protein
MIKERYMRTLSLIISILFIQMSSACVSEVDESSSGERNVSQAQTEDNIIRVMQDCQKYNFQPLNDANITGKLKFPDNDSFDPTPFNLSIKYKYSPPLETTCIDFTSPKFPIEITQSSYLRIAIAPTDYLDYLNDIRIAMTLDSSAEDTNNLHAKVLSANGVRLLDPGSYFLTVQPQDIPWSGIARLEASKALSGADNTISKVKTKGIGSLLDPETESQEDTTESQEDTYVYSFNLEIQVLSEFKDVDASE